MDPILQQILDLLETAPLTQTGKNDIRQTIRTEYYTIPETPTIEAPRRSVRLVTVEEDADCDCPIQHKHSRNGGIVCCFECQCAYTPEEHRRVISRVNLLE